MQTITDKKAHEKSTFAVAISFLDDAGASVVPGTAIWSLVDKDGSIINEKVDQPISPLAESVTVVLKDDDLQIQASEVGLSSVSRSLVVEWTYSSSLGIGLPGKEQISFVLENLKKVT